jgi:capsular polysaccharide transport system permease protein
MTELSGSGLDAELRRGAAIQYRTLAALVMRELHTRFGHNYTGYLWLLGEPAILAAGVAIIHLASGKRLPWGVGVADFAIAGYTCYYLFRSAANRSGSAIASNRTLLFHRHVKLFDILLSRAILETASTMGAAIFLLCLVWIIGLGHLPARPLRFMECWALNAWFCFGISMVCAYLCARFETAERLIHPATYLCMPVSGAFTFISELPPPVRPYIALFPPAQLTEMAREGVFGNFTSSYVSVPYMISWCAGLTLLGIILLRVIRRKIELS